MLIPVVITHLRRRKHHAIRYEPACLLPSLADPVGPGASQGGGEAPQQQQRHVFLHPRSALHGSAPELVVYTQLLRTDKRPYMAGITAVEVRVLCGMGADVRQ